MVILVIKFLFIFAVHDFGHDFTFFIQKSSNFGGFEWEIFPNFDLSNKGETFKSNILRIYGFFLTTLAYKILEFQLYVQKFKKLCYTTSIWQCKTFSVKHIRSIKLYCWLTGLLPNTQTLKYTRQFFPLLTIVA